MPAVVLEVQGEEGHGEAVVGGPGGGGGGGERGGQLEEGGVLGGEEGRGEGEEGEEYAGEEMHCLDVGLGRERDTTCLGVRCRTHIITFERICSLKPSAFGVCCCAGSTCTCR